MRGISKYGALATKIRGMRSYLLTEDELARLAGAADTKEIAVYLKGHPGYRSALSSLDPDNMRRETFERLLIYSLVRDVDKIYKFLGNEEKKYFNRAFIKVEIRFLKNCFRLVSNKYTSTVDLSIYKNLFSVIRCAFDFDKVVKAQTTDELCRALSGTIYEEPLKRLKEVNPAPDLFEYQRCLDMFYYSYIWEASKKYADKYDREILLKVNGEDIDLLNLICIYRLKAHFDVSEAEIFHYLIPAYYKLKRPQLAALCACKDVDEFMKACKKTYYGKYIDISRPESLEQTYADHMDSTYDKVRRSNPYSPAVIEAFIFNKRSEIDKLINITESVRYGYSQKIIIENLHIGGISQ